MTHNPPCKTSHSSVEVAQGSSCARLFAKSGMRVGIAARNPDKSVLLDLEIAARTVLVMLERRGQ